MGGALEARGIAADESKLTAESEGDIEVDDGVLTIKRIRVRYTLRGCPEDKRDAAIRAHDHHHPRCPVYRSINGCINITTELVFA
ncbi:MAG TPA: OsmC family protein [Candidatus Acidoferrum sp.]|nr:OsmC family protein [Candidatus Acidoferrum sp.]